MKCNQICPYNTLKGCVVMDRNGVCPLSITEPLGMSERLTKTKEFKFRLTEKEFEEMRELAEREGRTMSNLLRYLVAKEREEREK